MDVAQFQPTLLDMSINAYILFYNLQQKIFKEHKYENLYSTKTLAPILAGKTVQHSQLFLNLDISNGLRTESVQNVELMISVELKFGKFCETFMT